MNNEPTRSDQGSSAAAADELPVRIQLQRVKGWRMPPNTMKVDRSTKWGNPFVVGHTYPIMEEGATEPMGEDKCASASDAVAMFRSWMTSEYGPDQEEVEELAGKNLACWCKIGSPCHADVLLELANAIPDHAAAGAGGDVTAAIRREPGV